MPTGKKKKPSTRRPETDVVDHVADLVLARVEANRTADTVRPGVVGSVGLSIDDLKGLVAPLVKHALEIGVTMAGKTIEDLAAGQADLLDEFIPDAVYDLVSRIAARMRSEDARPHVVGEAQ